MLVKWLRGDFDALCSEALWQRPLRGKTSLNDVTPVGPIALRSAIIHMQPRLLLVTIHV